MKSILIIKTGSTFPEISKDRGDFEDWIIAGMGLDRNNFLIVDVSQGEALFFGALAVLLRWFFRGFFFDEFR